MQLFGKELTKRQVAAYVGDFTQVAGVERFTYDEGVEGGIKAARVRSGGGLDFTVMYSRGMDISAATYNGMPFAWVSSTGWGHPHAFVPEGRGWLQTFHGGLLTGCGLANAGAANVDGDESLGIHGKLSHIPAAETGAWTDWEDEDEATVYVEGTMREATVFGDNLRLRRVISTPIGKSSLTITDTVHNAGFKTSPLMLLYHLNFGWPLLSEDTVLRLPDGTETSPRDAVAASGIADARNFMAPISGYAEQCFYHEMPQGDVTAELYNQRLRFGVKISWNTRELPHFTQWKMTGEGEYVCGIEPGTCKVLGRAAEREAGRLMTIEPGEYRRHRVTITAFTD
jgi:hypothetical protein